jgi:hypothetical protein
LNPNYELDETISDLRDALYKIISSSRTGKLTLNMNASGTTVAKTAGFVTKFEATYFTDKPELTVTIQCDDPMFRGVNSVVLDDELVDASPLVVVDDLSTAPHGFALDITFTGTSATFTMQSAASNPDWKFNITPSTAFASGDALHMSTSKGSKYLYMVKSGVTTHLMDKILPTSMWPLIFPGANSFYIPEIASLDPDKLEYYPAYWGV